MPLASSFCDVTFFVGLLVTAAVDISPYFFVSMGDCAKFTVNIWQFADQIKIRKGFDFVILLFEGDELKSLVSDKA